MSGLSTMQETCWVRTRPNRRPSYRALSAICLVFCLQAGQAQEGGFRGESSTGSVFVNGEELSRPYVIEADAGGVRINGQALPLNAVVNGNRPRMREPDGNRPAQRRFAANGMGPARLGMRQNPWVSLGREMSLSLSEGAVLVAFEGHELGVLQTSPEKFALYDALLSVSPSQKQVQGFLALAPSEPAREVWKDWLAEFTPSLELRESMHAFVVEAMAREEAQRAELAAMKRLDQLSYPMTSLGMLLGVVAFGHLLLWAGKGFADVPRGEEAATRPVKMALCLLMGMAVFDLLWTVLASQAGMMQELNPFAAHLIDSPFGLAFFKFTLTGVALGILYFWRRRRLIQQAAWWSCLVCVLLTFRWVVLDAKGL